MKHLFSWVLLVMLCSLGISQFQYIKEVRRVQRDLDIMKSKPTIINVPVFDGEKETIRPYMTFGVSKMDGEVPVVIPIFIGEDEYADWRNKIRLAYVKHFEEQKEKEKHAIK